MIGHLRKGGDTGQCMRLKEKFDKNFFSSCASGREGGVAKTVWAVAALWLVLYRVAVGLSTAVRVNLYGHCDWK